MKRKEDYKPRNPLDRELKHKIFGGKIQGSVDSVSSKQQKKVLGETESVEEFLARGGKITKCEPASVSASIQDTTMPSGGTMKEIY